MHKIYYSLLFDGKESSLSRVFPSLTGTDNNLDVYPVMLYRKQYHIRTSLEKWHLERLIAETKSLSKA